MNLTDEITPEWLLSVGFQADGILGYSILLTPQLGGDELHDPAIVKLNVAMSPTGRWEVDLFQGNGEPNSRDDQIALNSLPSELRRNHLMALLMALGAFQADTFREREEPTAPQCYRILRELLKSMTHEELIEHSLHSQIHRMILMNHLDMGDEFLDEITAFYGGDEALLYRHIVADNELSAAYAQRYNSLN